MPKNGIIEDVISGLIKKAQLPDEAESGKIRIFEANNHRFFRDMSREYPVISINEYTTLLAERIPPEEAEATEKEYINCFHFQNEATRPHGIPFRFLLVPGEAFVDTRKRLEKRTGLKGKSFEKIKFALVRRPYSKVHYLQDSKRLLNKHKINSLGRRLTHLQMMFSRNWRPRMMTNSDWITWIEPERCGTVLETCS